MKYTYHIVNDDHENQITLYDSNDNIVTKISLMDCIQDGLIAQGFEREDNYEINHD